MSYVAKLQQQILSDAGIGSGRTPQAGDRLLDLGCGNGETVADWMALGLDSYGCDLGFKPGPLVGELSEEGRIRLIDTPYRLPFEDAAFDFVVSNQVMEHVQDYPAVLDEMRRVLKPDGVCLHIFPSRYMLIEPHVFVPLASIIRSKAWLSLWAIAGVRTGRQRGLGWRQVVSENRAYLDSSTNYLSRKELERQFGARFGRMEYAERSYLKHFPKKRGRMIAAVANAAPGVYWLFRECWMRVVILRR